MYVRDLHWLFCVTLVIIDSLIRRVKTVSKDVGSWLSRRLKECNATDSEPLSGKVQMKKWQEQSWQLFVHVVASLAEVTMLMEETWWNDPATCWIPHPFEQRGKARADLQFLYMAQLAVWMYTCFIHRFVDERRKDYYVMYLHHVVTIALVGSCCLMHHLLAGTRAGAASPLLVGATRISRALRARSMKPPPPPSVLAYSPHTHPPSHLSLSLLGVSWGNGYLRVGLLVLYVHDVSDIFVDLLKMVNYLKIEGVRGWMATEIAYGTCVVSWMYYRLYQFPFRAIYASFVEPLRLLSKHPRQPVTFLGLQWFPPDLPLYTEMNALLFTLLALHIYWFHLFLMIGYRIITENVREASRQEYEGDSDEEDGGDGVGGDRIEGATGSKKPMKALLPPSSPPRRTSSIPPASPRRTGGGGGGRTPSRG